MRLSHTTSGLPTKAPKLIWLFVALSATAYTAVNAQCTLGFTCDDQDLNPDGCAPFVGTPCCDCETGLEGTCLFFEGCIPEDPPTPTPVAPLTSAPTIGIITPQVFCSSLQCPSRTTPIVGAGAVECTDGICEESQCCEALCSYHQCPERSTPVNNANDIVCPFRDCTDELCCVALCVYFQCPSGTVPVEDDGEIVCPGLDCTDELCCVLP